MLSGKVPFQSTSAYEPSAMAIARSIMDGCVSFEGDEWTNVSSSAKDLILGMLDKFCFTNLHFWGALFMFT